MGEGSQPSSLTSDRYNDIHLCNHMKNYPGVNPWWLLHKRAHRLLDIVDQFFDLGVDGDGSDIELGIDLLDEVL